MAKFKFDDIYFPNKTILTGEQISSFDISKEKEKYTWVSKTNPALDQCVGRTKFICMTMHPKSKHVVHVLPVFGYNNMLKFAIMVAYYEKYEVCVHAKSIRKREDYSFTAKFDPDINKVKITFECNKFDTKRKRIIIHKTGIRE